MLVKIGSLIFFRNHTHQSNFNSIVIVQFFYWLNKFATFSGLFFPGKNMFQLTSNQLDYKEAEAR